MEVLIVLVGARQHDPDDPCSAAYHARVTETNTEVRLQLGVSSPVDRRPPPPSGTAYGCTAEGHTRAVTARLASPLGDRAVVEEQFERRHPVFDGDALAGVGWIPDGWSSRGEGPGFGGEEEGSWTQRFGPDRPPAKDGHCTATDADMSLSQQPVPAGHRLDGAQDEVRGAPAKYRTEGGHTASVEWVEHGWLYIVYSRSGCVGDTLASKETMLRFARALTVK